CLLDTTDDAWPRRTELSPSGYARAEHDARWTCGQRHAIWNRNSERRAKRYVRQFRSRRRGGGRHRQCRCRGGPRLWPGFSANAFWNKPIPWCSLLLRQQLRSERQYVFSESSGLTEDIFKPEPVWRTFRRSDS